MVTGRRFETIHSLEVAALPVPRAIASLSSERYW
jgi:hypothetical protein